MAFVSGSGAEKGQEARRWLKHYPECVPHSLDYPNGAAWQFLQHAAKTHPNRTACCYYQQRLSYAELDEAARQTAATLIDFGIQPGDRVGLLLPNIPEFISTLNGIWMAGGVAVTLSPLMVPEEIARLVKTTNCRMIVGLDLLAPLIAGNGSELENVLFVSINDRLPHWQQVGYAFARLRKLRFRPWRNDANWYWLEEERAKHHAAVKTISASSDDPAVILPTGGTTGTPKAVMLSHGNLVANAWQLYHWAGQQVGQETMLAVLPFFHSFGLTACLLTGTALSATLVLHHRFIPRTVLRLFGEHRPSIFPAVPAMLTALNDLLRDRPCDCRSLRFCITGGAPLEQPIAEEFRLHTGAVVVEGFGLSEASPVTHAGPLDGTDQPGTIGLPLPDTEARIVDDETGRRILQPGEVGELIVRGPQVMAGYWNNPQATAEAIRDGWLYTGDLATCDESGFFRIVDRKKDLIITSGFNVYPSDVEYVLREFPGIADVAVLGVPDADRGQLVKAVVTRNQGETFDRSAFDKYAQKHLAKHKRPRLVEVVDGDLPRNFLGKVQRKQLRQEHAQAEVATEPAAAWG